jgi:hypothetical protein
MSPSKQKKQYRQQQRRVLIDTMPSFNKDVEEESTDDDQFHAAKRSHRTHTTDDDDDSLAGIENVPPRTGGGENPFAKQSKLAMTPKKEKAATAPPTTNKEPSVVNTLMFG